MRGAFVQRYKTFTRDHVRDHDFGFELKTLARLEPAIAFLYEDWFDVTLDGLDKLPAEGPAMIIGNNGGLLPWTAIMLAYALMAKKQPPRRLHMFLDMSSIDDERLYTFLTELGFVSWSADAAKKIFEAGEIAFVYPESPDTAMRARGEHYRLRDFDWTKMLPAIEMGVPIFPLAAMGPDEVGDVWTNNGPLAEFLGLPAFPVTSRFPWLPFPGNVVPRRMKWFMRVMRATDCRKASDDRDDIEKACKNLAFFAGGEVQAELNRMLRTRIKTIF